MKICSRLYGIIPVFILITFVCTNCDIQPDNDDYLKILKTEKWNGFEFRHRADATDNQYKITINKFKTVFNSDSFTDNERENIRSGLDIIVIVGVGPGRGGFSGGYGTVDYYLRYLYCNSIKDEIERDLRNMLR